MKLSVEKIRKYFEVRLQGQPLPMKDAAVVRCPFHDDRTPSMSINFEKGVWNCHAGCGSGGLVDFERKLTSCDDDTAKARIGDLVDEPQLFGDGQRPEAVYEYRDANGRLLFQKLRYAGKRFATRKPNTRHFDCACWAVEFGTYSADELTADRRHDMDRSA